MADDNDPGLVDRFVNWLKSDKSGTRPGGLDPFIEAGQNAQDAVLRDTKVQDLARGTKELFGQKYDPEVDNLAAALALSPGRPVSRDEALAHVLPRKYPNEGEPMILPHDELRSAENPAPADQTASPANYNRAPGHYEGPYPGDAAPRTLRGEPNFLTPASRPKQWHGEADVPANRRDVLGNPTTKDLLSRMREELGFTLMQPGLPKDPKALADALLLLHRATASFPRGNPATYKSPFGFYFREPGQPRSVRGQPARLGLFDDGYGPGPTGPDGRPLPGSGISIPTDIDPAELGKFLANLRGIKYEPYKPPPPPLRVIEGDKKADGGKAGKRGSDEGLRVPGSMVDYDQPVLVGPVSSTDTEIGIPKSMEDYRARSTTHVAPVPGIPTIAGYGTNDILEHPWRHAFQMARQLPMSVGYTGAPNEIGAVMGALAEAARRASVLGRFNGPAGARYAPTTPAPQTDLGPPLASIEKARMARRLEGESPLRIDAKGKIPPDVDVKADGGPTFNPDSVVGKGRRAWIGEGDSDKFVSHLQRPGDRQSDNIDDRRAQSSPYWFGGWPRIIGSILRRAYEQERMRRGQAPDEIAHEYRIPNTRDWAAWKGTEPNERILPLPPDIPSDGVAYAEGGEVGGLGAFLRMRQRAEQQAKEDGPAGRTGVRPNEWHLRAVPQGYADLPEPTMVAPNDERWRELPGQDISMHPDYFARLRGGYEKAVAPVSQEFAEGGSPGRGGYSNADRESDKVEDRRGQPMVEPNLLQNFVNNLNRALMDDRNKFKSNDPGILSKKAPGGPIHRPEEPPYGEDETAELERMLESRPVIQWDNGDYVPSQGRLPTPVEHEKAKRAKRKVD